MDPAYGEQYRELFKQHWWWRARAEVIEETLRRLEPPQGWGSILDVGCGDGLFFDCLLQFGEVEGVEPATALVSASGLHRKRIHIGPFDESYQPGKLYSLVLMLDVLEHLPDPVAALRHALALLAPGGTFLATVPAFKLLWTNHDVLNHHLTRYTKGSFRALARRAGLSIRNQRYLFQWTCPVKLAVRIIENLFNLQPRSPRIPPRWINETLYLLSRVEQKTLGALPVPFGSTLMVIGHRPRA